jgi:hypothetical protein
MMSVSAKHCKWANMIKEFNSQLKDIVSDIGTITDHMKNSKWNDSNAETYTSPGVKNFEVPKPPHTRFQT